MRQRFAFFSCVLAFVAATYASLASDHVEQSEGSGIGVGVVTAREMFGSLKKNKLPVPSNRSGALISWILSGGPADLAGLKKFDIVRKIDGKDISDASAFRETIRSLPTGKAIKFYVFRIDLDAKFPRWQAKTIPITPASRDVMARLVKSICPLEITGVGLRKNIIGVPEVLVRLKNVSASDVVAAEINTDCWNRFDEKVSGWGNRENAHHGLSQTTIPRGDERTISWQLVGHETTAKVSVSVIRVKMANGVEWKPENGRALIAEAELDE